ncbi:MAG: 3-hydroxyacyl-CoA dehydrogenase NAD-binding domain-containing protein [Oceanicaulis sp.]
MADTITNQGADTGPVSLSFEDGVAVVRIDNPPVNALSHAVRAGLAAALDEVEARGADALVIACAGRTFVAGADVREFDAPPRPPHLPDLLVRIAALAVPSVAALHGAALGGGLELALACDARVARSGSKLGLPETTLGLIPGAGGTQRLPRLIGVNAALDMVVDGKPVSAERAHALGLVDQICGGDPAAAALAMATAGIAKRAPGAPAPDPDSVAAARAHAARRYAREPARHAAIDRVAASVTDRLEDGLRSERETFLTLKSSPEARALRHVFFAERAASKPEPDCTDHVARPVTRIAVIGAGTMGAGIASACAGAGLGVTLIDAQDDALRRGVEQVDGFLARQVEKGRMGEPAAAAARADFQSASHLSAAGEADLIIEAVFEDLELKKRIFAELGDVAKPGAVLATNTSYLDIDAIAEATDRPANVLGLHFFSPAPVMKLLEVVRAGATAPDVLLTGLALARRLNKQAVIARVGHGFIGNRCWSGYVREAGLMLTEGASPEAIDAALRRFGMPMGPMETLDLAGLDIGYMMRRQRDPESLHPNAYAVLDALVEAGRKGRKTGAGVYVYDADAKRDDGEAARLAAVAREARGIEARAPSDDEIVARCVLALVGEGRALLSEGVARQQCDIDVALVDGYGFPRWRGGPMHWAETFDADAMIAGFAARYGARWWGGEES